MDYISRDDVLKAIDYQHEVNNVFESEAAYVQMWETINDDIGIKSADVQPVDRWISVDEALPEKDGYYLVVTQGIHNPTIDIAGFWHYAEFVQKEIRENYWNKYDKVIYWQPLPELPEAIKG